MLAVIEQRPGSEDVQLRSAAAPQTLSALSAVAVRVGGEQVQVTRERTAAAHGRRLVWHGRFGESGEVLLVVDGDQITGSVQKPSGEMFKIEPLGGGLHTVSRIDQTAVGECATESNSERDGGGDGQTAPGSTGSGGSSGALSTPTLDVLVVYTPGAAAASANIGNEVALAVADMNNGFGNSSVPATISVVHAAQLAFNESSDIFNDRDDLLGTSDGRGDAVHSLRSQYGADVVVLLTDGNYVYQGSSVYSIAGAIGAVASQAFAIVEWDYATGNHTFAHEIGHLAGARHDNDTGTQPYSYGHGYRPGGQSWRTIMAMGSPSSSPFRINYWSNPDKVYGGVAMGTTSYNDNVRAWENSAATMAGFRTPPPPPGPLTASITGPSILGFKEYGTYTCSTSGGSGSPTTRQWSERTPPATAWTAGPTTTTYTIQMGNLDRELRCIVTRGTGTATATKLVTYSSVPPVAPGPTPGVTTSVFALDPPRPNPSAESATVAFSLAEGAETTLVLYDALGREVARPVSGWTDAGAHTTTLAVGSLPSGVYVVRLTSGPNATTARLSVAR